MLEFVSKKAYEVSKGFPFSTRGANAKTPSKVSKMAMLGVLLCPKCCNKVAMPEVAKGRKREVFEIVLFI